jgi:hypothetical protein
VGKSGAAIPWPDLFLEARAFYVIAKQGRLRLSDLLDPHRMRRPETALEKETGLTYD